MRSEVHAVSLVIFTGLISILYQGNLETTLVWMFIAGLSSFLIDIDHFILAYFVGDKKEAVKHFLTNYSPSSRLEESIGYEKMRKHRNITHTSIGTLSVIVSYLNPVFYPVAAGLSVHVLQDLYSDYQTLNY